MPADDEPTAALATIAANQANTTTLLGEMREEMREARDKGERSASEIHKRVNEVGTGVTEIGTKLDGHIAEDNRRFANIWRVLGWGTSGIAAVVGAGWAITKAFA